MKLFFSLIFTINAYAFEAVVIQYQSNLKHAELAKTILSKTFNFPEELISIKKTDCSVDENIMLQICARDNGEYDVLRMNDYYVKNYFAEFTKRNGENYEL